MGNNTISINKSKTEVLVDTLLRRIEFLQDENTELRRVSIDNMYRSFCEERENAMIEALKANGRDLSYKKGDIVFADGCLYLVHKMLKNGDVLCGACLFDYVCDCQHEYGIETGDGITFDQAYNPRPASEYEIMLFDYELGKQGYRRTADGIVVKYK